MKAVLISIQPQWVEKIAVGMKTLELRKTAPNLPTPFKCYIYQTRLKWAFNLLRRLRMDRIADTLTAGFGKVVGEFVCDSIIGHCEMANADIADQQSCVRRGKILEYSGGKEVYGWHIYNPVIYDEPKPLWKFMKCGAPTEKELDEELCSYCEQTEWGERRCYGTPDGPVMCEGAFCGEAYDLYLDANFALKRPPQSWCYVEELK